MRPSLVVSLDRYKKMEISCSLATLDLLWHRVPKYVVEYSSTRDIHNHKHTHIVVVVTITLMCVCVCVWSQKASETVSEVVNFKIFLGGGGACPQIPLASVRYRTLEFSPSTNNPV